MKYRKKPVVIEAFQLTYDVVKGNSPVPVWAKEAADKGVIKIAYTDKIENSQSAVIKTLEGEMRANANDYIIKGIKGEIYPCKPEIFEATYEKI